MAMLSAYELPRYDDYKESGVEWLGRVPIEWEVARLKFSSRINPPPRIGGEDLLNDACFLPMEVVHSSGKVEYGIRKPIKELKQGFTAFQRKDVIMAKITPCFENGKGACLDSMPTKYGFGSTEFHVLRASSGFNPKYIYYLTKTDLFMSLGESLMTGSAGQKRVQTEFVANFSFAFPVLDVQDEIVRFLDKKTTQIDEAIAIKEQQIALLKERKQIIIQKAVTQGLDPTVPMKDSGVDWIGAIPAHWEVKRLKYVLEERSERSVTGEEPLFMVSQVHGLVVRADFHDKAEVAASNIDNKIVYENDLVFNKLKAHLGVFFKSSIDFKGSVSPDYAVYTCKNYIKDAKYLEFLFRHPLYIEQFIIRATGVVEGLIRLYTSDLFDIPVPVAPVEEQRAILEYSEEQSRSYERAIELQLAQIEKLKEYKTTLINSAVTGKIRITPDMVEG
ncbi:restriction endonuclease subunit S [Marinobacter xestospongiae]|uniref:Restriction endonuclease subunit S n=1 Tax=Marinobacter xestospongiae TaxID=994319 RepID=A0ABU3VYQ7_9GAMM|nr:restriction endonuclease subunit S [Marinobacter xestospongiae]MDV2079389.1 restriction endonuclease subunit S [Marinobacter xestospongiae]